VESYYRQIESGKNHFYWNPLRIHDYCPLSDGMAAVILCSKPQDVLVSGLGSATDIPTIADRRYFHSFPATVIAAAYAYGMAGIRNIRSFAGKLHVNMHDPFNGFGPINLVDLGIVSRNRLMDALLDDALTGEAGDFPTNLTGGLKGRGHPLGATGMIQIVENHRMIRDGRFSAALSHSIGGPINNNVVVLLERGGHYAARHHEPFKPWGLPSLGRLKPKNISLASLLAGGRVAEGTFVTSTARFTSRTSLPEEVVAIVACRFEGGLYRFLFGIGGEHYEQVAALRTGEPVSLDMVDGVVAMNRMPVRKFYKRTLGGLVGLGGISWKRFTRKE